MKRNVILLISVLVSSIILASLGFRSKSLSNETKIHFNQKNKGIGDLFGVFGNQAMEKNGAWPRVETLRDLNLNIDDDPLEVFDCSLIAIKIISSCDWVVSPIATSDH